MDEIRLKIINALLTQLGGISFACDYTNWRGEKSRRHLVALRVWHGKTDWHPAPGLILKAKDLDKGEMRDFCVKDFDLTTMAVKAEKDEYVKFLNGYETGAKAVRKLAVETADTEAHRCGSEGDEYGAKLADYIGNKLRTLPVL